MTTHISVKPAAGKVVIDPATRMRLPQTGADVPETTYWLRRLADGDVIKAEPAPPKPKAKRATSQADTDTSRSDP
ncbi:MAG: DUF2635 domain-containing protein [Xanthomonadaceae bacterium]|nr:DUF2635 domain-containing protein [Xanthomonadaceae bacterium]